MNTKKFFRRGLILSFILLISSHKIWGSETPMNALIEYLGEHDIIITQNTKNNRFYEGYDPTSSAMYKILTDENFQITDFTLDIVGTTYEEINFHKILGLKWFIDHYLDKNEGFLKEIRHTIHDAPYSYSSVIDLGEWKINLLVFPLSGGKYDLSLHFMDDSTQGNLEIKKNTLTALEDIYKELGCIETENLKVQPHQLHYKLPYYKLNTNESLYYNSFFNPKGLIYKTQFIFYKTGFDFTYKDIPEIKKIISIVTNNKDYPFDKLDIQFDHLKDTIIQEKDKAAKSISSWEDKGFKTVMDLERYTLRDACRIKITIYLVKK